MTRATRLSLTTPGAKIDMTESQITQSLRSLELAIARDDFAAAVALLDRQPELLNARFPENIGLTPLMWACRKRREPVVRELLARGAEVHLTNTLEPNGDGGNTALWFTAQGPTEGTVPIARRLVDGGATLDTRCEHGTTALFMAAAWCHLDLVQFLLFCGADPKLTDARGLTPLESLRQNIATSPNKPPWNPIRPDSLPTPRR